MSPEAQHHAHLAQQLAASGKTAQAIEQYRLAVALDSTNPDYFFNLGHALKSQHHFPQAVAAFQQAISLRNNFPQAWNNIANIYRELHQPESAIAAYEQILKLHPDFPIGWNNLALALKDVGQLDPSLAAFDRAVALDPQNPAIASNRLCFLQFHPRFNAAAILSEHQKWNEKFARLLQPANPIFPNDPNPKRKLRIGYISPYFRQHCQSLFTSPLFSNHDHQHFEIFCYSDVAIEDSITTRLKTYADHWRIIANLPDEKVAAQIRSDQIDILVDLTLHMAGNRLLVFARKPAPVQITWLGYPGTTGLTAIDYRFTDPHLDSTENFYSEKSITLPHTFWCYDPKAMDDQEPPPINSLPANSNGYITFGCLNNFCKITDPTLKLWSTILNEIPNSRLILLAPPGSHREKILSHFKNVQFVEFQPRQKYLELYHQIDICLDTLPYNGHTTSLDAFHMGVPVITKIGPTVVGRAGLSQLTNLKLEELAAPTDSQFQKIVTDLANNLPKLSHLRATLRQRMQQSPLMDGPGFARSMESAFRGMWKK